MKWIENNTTRYKLKFHEITIWHNLKSRTAIENIILINLFCKIIWLYFTAIIIYNNKLSVTRLAKNQHSFIVIVEFIYDVITYKHVAYNS